MIWRFKTTKRLKNTGQNKSLNIMLKSITIIAKISRFWSTGVSRIKTFVGILFKYPNTRVIKWQWCWVYCSLHKGLLCMSVLYFCRQRLTQLYLQIEQLRSDTHRDGVFVAYSETELAEIQRVLSNANVICFPAYAELVRKNSKVDLYNWFQIFFFARLFWLKAFILAKGLEVIPF